jgi:ankyrin repeat protein
MALLLVILTGMVNCKGKGEKPAGTTTTANAPVPRAASPPSQQGSSVDQQALNDAALNGELEKVKELTMQGADPNHIDQEGRTALMFSSFNGHTEIVRLLLNGGAEISIRDAMGRTALLYASTGPFPETVKLLLDHHADPNIVDNDEHFSPLMHAAAEGQLEVVKLLLASGADPALKDIDGETAALFARNNGHTEVAGLIQSALDAN